MFSWHHHAWIGPRLAAKAPLTVRDARGQSLLHVAGTQLVMCHTMHQTRNPYKLVASFKKGTKYVDYNLVYPGWFPSNYIVPQDSKPGTYSDDSDALSRLTEPCCSFRFPV